MMDLFEFFDGQGFSIVDDSIPDSIDVEIMKGVSEIYEIIYWATKGGSRELLEEEILVTEERLSSLLGFQVSLSSITPPITLEEVLEVLEDLFSVNREDIFEFCSSPVVDVELLRTEGIKVGRFFKSYSPEQIKFVLRRKIQEDLNNSFSFVFPIVNTLSGERGYNSGYPKEIWDKYFSGSFIQNVFEGPRHFEDLIVIEIMEYFAEKVKIKLSGRNEVIPFFRKGFRPGIILIKPECYREMCLKFPHIVSFHKHYYLPAVSREIKRRGGGKYKK